MMQSLMFQQQQQQLVVEENMSNLTSASGEASVSSGNRNEIATNNYHPQQQYFASPSSTSQTTQQPLKKKRNLPGNPDPDAEVIALSPKSLLATNRFICEICNKGFQRDQNLQLHRRGHNLPWKLKQRTNKEVRKKVYVCPEATCVHHDPARALGDLTGIKKHFCRKHGEKKWKCDKCSKKYAVQSDWKAHSKTCGTREYRCDCGALFSRRDSFITHRAFCDALAEESARSSNPPSLLHNNNSSLNLQTHFNNNNSQHQNLLSSLQLKKEQSFNLLPPWLSPGPSSSTMNNNDLSSPSPSSRLLLMDQDFSQTPHHGHHLHHHHENPNPIGGPTLPPAYQPAPSPHMSATALLQKAAQMGASTSSNTPPQPQQQHQQPMIRTHHLTHVMPPPLPSDPYNNNSNGNGNFCLNLSSSRDTAVVLSSSTTTTSVLHDVMSSFSTSNAAATTVSAASGFDGTSFEDAFVGGILGSKNGKDANFLDTLSKMTNPTGDNNNGEGLTRDFLGLAPLSHSDILSFAGIGNCMNPTSTGATSSHDQHKLSQKPWQG